MLFLIFVIMHKPATMERELLRLMLFLQSASLKMIT